MYSGLVPLVVCLGHVWSWRPVFVLLFSARMPGMFLNPTFIPYILAWEKVWRGGGWCWQSWLHTDEGLAESTCFLSIPEPDWLRVQVACICFMPYLWEAHWDGVSLGTGKSSRPRKEREPAPGSFQRTVLRVGPTRSQIWMGVGTEECWSYSLMCSESA